MGLCERRHYKAGILCGQRNCNHHVDDRLQQSEVWYLLSIYSSELKQIKGCNTSREVWLRFESIYQSKEPARKATLLKRLMFQRMNDEDDLKNHLGKFFDVVDKLEKMEVKIDNNLLSVMLLYSLLEKY